MAHISIKLVVVATNLHLQLGYFILQLDIKCAHTGNTNAELSIATYCVILNKIYFLL